MAERVTVDATGQAHIEGEAEITVYAAGVYPIRLPPEDAAMWCRPLPIPSAFLTNDDLKAVS